MSKRRYKIGINPEYDSTFDNLKERSGILNPNKSGISSVCFDLWSRTGLELILAEWAGTEDDGTFEDIQIKRWVNSRLRDAQDRLAAVDTKFENMKINKQRAGRYPPETMPPEMVEEKHRREAAIDILEGEIENVKKRLAKHQATEKKQDDHLVLAHGPAGSCHGTDPPRSIDGQKVVWSEKQGHFLIDCEKSPFHQMRLPDYYLHIARPWRDAKRALVNELQVQANDLNLPLGERLCHGNEAARIRRLPNIPPWPERPPEA